MKRLLYTILLPVSFYCEAQKIVDVNASNANSLSVSSFYSVGGVPFANTKFVNLVEGTPYFATEWLKGRVIDDKGRRYTNTLLKVDLLNNELHFLNQQGTELVASITAREIFLEDTLTQTAYHLVHTSQPGADKNIHWYQQLLDSGRANLYKTYTKSLSESLRYGSSTHEQRIFTNVNYYLELNRTLVGVKNLKDLPALLPAKRLELEIYLKSRDDKGLSQDERWKKAIEFYNSLPSD